ncbi:MAG TPA: MFS transporter [Mycobacteriales bacterium]|jgi:MFS family permease|nr:MFS transporter [Mycobacteriales bacterium]
MTSTIDQPADTEASSNRSLVPARLDRLDWSRFHTRLVIALGVAWILDGLEITIAANVTPIISTKAALGLGSGSVAFSVGTVYLLGEVAGALFFGRLSDKWGRKNLFMITLGVYLAGGALTACTAGKGQFWVYWLDTTRFIAGMGIGGEYAAINSAIDELVPAKYRGRVDIGVNGTYWAGALIASILTVGVVNHISAHWSWRLAFLLGPALAFVILFVRKNLPESPRWLLMHGHADEAEATVKQIEDEAAKTTELAPVDESKAIDVATADDMGFITLAWTLFRRYPSRAFYVATLMITQSFLYNAIFFTYALVLNKVYGVSTGHTPYYFMAFAVGNFIGPLVLGRLFDTIGRRRMIAGTYLISAVMLAISAVMFKAGELGPVSQTAWWCAIFFFASAGASAAYLTASEVFPVEVRAKAIAVFFAIAQSFGSFGPWLYGHLIGNGTDHTKLFYGYVLGAVVMAIGGITAAVIGVDAEGKSLEDIATPLSLQRTGAAPLKTRGPKPATES